MVTADGDPCLLLGRIGVSYGQLEVDCGTRLADSRTAEKGNQGCCHDHRTNILCSGRRIVHGGRGLRGELLVSVAARAATSRPRQAPSLEPQENPHRIEAQGRLEPVSGTLAVGALPGEEIVQLNAHVGQAVEKDEVLAVLGSLELRSCRAGAGRAAARESQAPIRGRTIAGQAARGSGSRFRSSKPKRTRKKFRRKNRSVSAQQRLELAEAQLERLEQLKKDPQTQEAIVEGGTGAAAIAHQTNPGRVGREPCQAGSGSSKPSSWRSGLRNSMSLMAQTTQDNLVKASPLPVLQQSVELAKLAEKVSVVRAPCDGTDSRGVRAAG